MLVLLPVMLGSTTMRWSDKVDGLLITKVNRDLTIADQYLARLLENPGERLDALAKSVALADALTADADVASFIALKRAELRLDFLYLTNGAVGPDGFAVADWPVVQQAIGGQWHSAVDIMSLTDLATLGADLAECAAIPLVETRAAVPTDRRVEDRGMIIHSAASVALRDGSTAVLVGGMLLNRNLDFIDTINALVYQENSLPQGSQGTATLFLLITALSVPIFLRWAGRIFLPLERMNQTMLQVEAGDFQARNAPQDGDNEIAQVAGHLDDLLDQLQERDRHLREWGEQLNQKVEERARDLSESNRKLEQTTERLIISEKLAAVGEITAGVAHEITNPIAVIQGNLDLARDLLGPATDLARTEFNLIDDQVYRIGSLVSKLLQFARPEEFSGAANLVWPAEATGMAIMGFGGGAMIAAPVKGWLLKLPQARSRLWSLQRRRRPVCPAGARRASTLSAPVTPVPRRHSWSLGLSISSLW